MKQQTRYLGPEILQELIKTRGENWIRFGSENLSPELDVAPESVQFETSGGGFELFAREEVVDLEEDPDSLAVLYLERGKLSGSTTRRGNLSYKFSGAKIVEIFLLVSEIRESVNTVPTFTFLSHDGIVFQLESGWVGFSKEGVWAEDIHVSVGEGQESLDLYDALNDWESNLEVTYSGETKLVQLQEWLNDFTE